VTETYRDIVERINVAETSGLYTQLRIGPILMVDAFAARRNSDDLPALLLELHADSLRGVDEWPESVGFRVDVEPSESGSKSRVRVYLQLTEERFSDIFYVLCEDVRAVLETATDEHAAVVAFHSRLVRWQAFLKKHEPDGLSPEAQVGLFGELLVLRDVFLPRIDAFRSVQAWRGCKKAHQDFQFPGRALEVKTTRAVIPDRISISNVQQLDEAGIETLVLTVVHVHAGDAAGVTLPMMVNSIREGLPASPGERFNEGLFEVGYLDEHAELYSKTMYELNGLIHHEVTEGFPRLLRNQVPDGVKKVRYEITIDAARPFVITDERVHEIFEETDDTIHS